MNPLVRHSHWRHAAAPIIAKILQETKGQGEKEIRAALREAYPFGQRQYHPYKMWLKEIKFQMGKLSGRNLVRDRGVPPETDPRQESLFQEVG
jgi:hypothetical protein